MTVLVLQFQLEVLDTMDSKIITGFFLVFLCVRENNPLTEMIVHLKTVVTKSLHLQKEGRRTGISRYRTRLTGRPSKYLKYYIFFDCIVDFKIFGYP